MGVKPVLRDFPSLTFPEYVVIVTSLILLAALGLWEHGYLLKDMGTMRTEVDKQGPLLLDNAPAGHAGA